MRTAEQAARELMDACTARDYDRIRTICHPEYLHVAPDGVEGSGIEHAVEQTEDFLRGFPDAEFEGTYYPASDTVCFAEGVIRGTHRGEANGIPPSGNRIAIRLMTVFVTRDGLIWQEREYYDRRPIFGQLGVTLELKIGTTTS